MRYHQVVAIPLFIGPNNYSAITTPSGYDEWIQQASNKKVTKGIYLGKVKIRKTNSVSKDNQSKKKTYSRNFRAEHTIVVSSLGLTIAKINVKNHEDAYIKVMQKQPS